QTRLPCCGSSTAAIKQQTLHFKHITAASTTQQRHQHLKCKFPNPSLPFPSHPFDRPRHWQSPNATYAAQHSHDQSCVIIISSQPATTIHCSSGCRCCLLSLCCTVN
ncbi:hypothetical protein SAMD00019534_034190, partial [Acytostelium subglobosum LB1]|uniref:hypothetical protein n=1 Tax=Acytostelium subglobosum LB1 TaxID=1410327 RepID=UPI00064484D8